MRESQVICDGRGSVCPPGEFLTLPSGPGSPKLKAIWGGQKELCPERVEAHVNLGAPTSPCGCGHQTGPATGLASHGCNLGDIGRGLEGRDCECVRSDLGAVRRGLTKVPTPNAEKPIYRVERLVAMV